MGLTVTADHALALVAQHGLDDLFGLRVQHNPARAGTSVDSAQLEDQNGNFT